jgi:hypothetical protein
MVREGTFYLTVNLGSGSSYLVAAAFHCILTTITVTQNVIARFARDRGRREREDSVTGNAQTAPTATEIANAATIEKKDGPATRKNADEIARVKTTPATRCRL